MDYLDWKGGKKTFYPIMHVTYMTLFFLVFSLRVCLKSILYVWFFFILLCVSSTNLAFSKWHILCNFFCLTHSICILYKLLNYNYKINFICAVIFTFAFYFSAVYGNHARREGKKKSQDGWRWMKKPNKAYYRMFKILPSYIVCSILLINFEL